MVTSAKLPPEILNFLPQFTEREQQLIKERGNLSHDATLKQMIDVLLDVYYSITLPSDNFCFLLGRLLYFVGDFDKLDELSIASGSPGFVLWRILRELHKGKLPITLDHLHQLEKDLKGSSLYCFSAYIYAHYFYFIGDFAEFRKHREVIYNLCFEECPPNFETKAIYKVILGHMFALDATFLRTTNTLTISTNRIEEAINLSKAINDRILQVIVYTVAGMIEQEKGNFQLSHQFLLRSQAIAKKADIRKIFSTIYLNLGNLYFLMAQYGEALNWYNKALAEIDKWKDDIRLRYLILSNIAKVYYATEKVKDAITLMEEVLSILSSTQIKEFPMHFQYIEFLLTDGNLELSKQKLQEMQKFEDSFSTSQKAHFAYLQGLLELHMHNYGLAEQYLQKALSIADYVGNETISYESLAVLLLVYLHRYELNQKLDDILMADKCLEDIIAYLKEKAKYDAIVLLYYTRAKIKIIIYNFEIAYFLLKQGEKYARIYAPEMTQRYETQFKLLQSMLEKEKVESEIITEKVDFRFEMANYLGVLKKESLKAGPPTEQQPFAVLILHSSGIPIRTYFNPDISISDDLLFGGLISSIRHLINELFTEKKVAFLSVDQGQYKILIEFYSNLFSVVIVALRDSYMLRRKLHYLVEKISHKMIVGSKFSGALSDSVLIELDSIVQTLFKLKWSEYTIPSENRL